MPGEVKIENQAEASNENHLIGLLQARDEINNELVMRDKKMMSGPSDKAKIESAATMQDDSDNFGASEVLSPSRVLSSSTPNQMHEEACAADNPFEIATVHD